MAIQSNFPAIKPSLMLDFANTKQLDSRITYTRASTATFYNGVTTAMAEQNLVLQSQTFETTWTLQSGSTITANTSTAPDGTTTADTFNEGTGSAYHDVEQSLTLQTGAYTVSCYMKYVDQQYGIISLSSASNAYVAASFDLIGGTVSASSNSGALTTLTGATITSVGGSWYRCTVSGTVVTAGTFVVRLAIATTGTIGAFGIGTYTGTSKTALFWGAQLEQRSAVSAYTATTTQAITNYIPALQTAASGVARFDNNPTTGESLGLLIEESRTNLFTYSADYTNAAWGAKTGLQLTVGAIAPDNTTSLKVESTAAGTRFLGQTVTTTASTAYTGTAYLKKNTTNFGMLSIVDGANQGSWTFDLNAGTVGTNVTSTLSSTATITSVGNGWYRCSVTATSTTTSLILRIIPVTSTSVGTSAIYDAIFAWGAQFEAGAFATSYIPTVASQVTRAADAASMTGTNFSSWYNQGEGTIYQEVNPRILSGSYAPAWITSGDSITNNGIGSFLSTAGHLYVEVSGSVQCSIDAGTVTASTNNKIAGTYKTNDFAAVIDNGTVGTDAVGVIPTVDRVMIGRYGSTYMNGTIKKIAYYPLRVTNAQLQALTS